MEGWKLTIDSLDHTNRMIILNKNHVKRILKYYIEYYDEDQTHLSLDKCTQIELTIQQRPGLPVQAAEARSRCWKWRARMKPPVS